MSIIDVQHIVVLLTYLLVVCLEAVYANTKNKQIIPLRLEADYEPDGWLGALCLTRLYYDFSDPEKFDDGWSKLHAQLKELLKRQGWEYCNKTVVFISHKLDHKLLQQQ